MPISLREKLSYIAWAIIPGFMSKRCKNKARIKRWTVNNGIYREFNVICSIFYFTIMGISKRIAW